MSSWVWCWIGPARNMARRAWLLWLAIPFAIAAVLLFTVPDANDTIRLVYVVITYNIALLIYTGVEIPHGTLGALITDDQHQRSVLNVAKMVGAYLAIIAISTATIPIVDLLGGGQAGWIRTFVLYGIVAAAIYFTTFAFTRERTHRGGGGHTAEQPALTARIRALFNNQYWLIASAVLLFMYIYNAMTSGVAVYFAKYILHAPMLVGAVTTALTLATLAGMLAIVPIAGRFGKRNTAIAGCLVAVAGSLIIAINAESVSAVLIGQIVRGIGKAGVMGVIFAMLADTMEYGEWKTGIRLEGLIYSGASMGIKIGTGLGSGLIGWGLAISGYVGTNDVQTPEAASMIAMLFIWVPLLVSLAIAGLLYAFRLDRYYPDILADLRRRERQAAR